MQGVYNVGNKFFILPFGQDEKFGKNNLPNKWILLSVISYSLFLTFLYSVESNDLQGSNTGWKAGVARVVITPEQSMWMAGYGGRDHSSEGTIHDLWAKATASLSDAIILFDKVEHYKMPSQLLKVK